MEGRALEISSPRLYSVPPAGADVPPGAAGSPRMPPDAAGSARVPLEELECSWRDELRVRTVVSSCWRSITARASEVLRSLGEEDEFTDKMIMLWRSTAVAKNETKIVVGKVVFSASVIAVRWTETWAHE